MGRDGIEPPTLRFSAELGALRHQAWGAASQSCGAVSLPPDAAVQQQPQPVVGEVAEAMPDPLDLFDEQVQCLGGPVGAPAGGVEGEDLGLPGSHGADQPGQLRELDAILPAAEALSRRVIFSLGTGTSRFGLLIVTERHPTRLPRSPEGAAARTTQQSR
jgi:hypothetical protein